MNKHIRHFTLLGLTSVVLLSSCTLLKMAGLSDGSTITISLSKSTLKENTALLDNIDVTVEYQTKSGEKTDVTQDATGWLEDSKGNKCSIYDLLDSGNYVFYAKYTPLFSNALTASTPITVTANASVVDGKGYEPVSDRFFTKSNISDYENLSVLGPLNLPNHATDGVNPQVLVIPVYFKGDNQPSASDIESIDNAFFGTADKTGWQSLNSYYQASSYGTLDIEGAVASPVQLSETDTDCEKAYDENNNEAGVLVQEAVEKVRQSQPSLFLENHNFDSNHDGYIDGVEVIYFHKTYPMEQQEIQDRISALKKEYVLAGISRKQEIKAEIAALEEELKNISDFFWAYTTNVSENLNKGNVLRPMAYRYFFASYYQIMNGYYKDTLGNMLPDAHTLVHENGHMLGLDDYYDYSYTTGPSGLANMMDLNIGDLDPFSKMELGWAKPQVVNGQANDFILTLKPFASTGDCLIVKTSDGKDFNNTVYDNYLVLSYYTPTGLNEQDSKGYEEWSSCGTGGMYDQSGLQVYLVDARTVNVTQNSHTGTVTHVEFTDDPMPSASGTADSVTYSMIGQSNSKPDLKNGIPGAWNTSRNDQSDYRRLFTAIPSDGTTKFLNSDFQSRLGTSGTLFDTKAGTNSFSKFKYSKYFTDGKFADGTDLSYGFRVLSMTQEGIEIRFTKF